MGESLEARRSRLLDLLENPGLTPEERRSLERQLDVLTSERSR